MKDIKSISDDIMSNNKYKLLEILNKNTKIQQKILINFFQKLIKTDKLAKDYILLELIKYNTNRISEEDIERVINKYNYDGDINMQEKYNELIKNDIKKLLYNKTKELSINKNNKLEILE